MKFNIYLGLKDYYIDTYKPIDISIPMGNMNESTAWYVPNISIQAVKNENFIGSVKMGSSVNFNNITFNPHGNGTHTECVGHISETVYSVNNNLKKFWFKALLISINPIEVTQEKGTQKIGDRMITLSAIQESIEEYKLFDAEAIIIRTLPNQNKLGFNYSNTNPPYLDSNAAKYIRDKGFKHLLIDLPSVDKEVDNGELLAHKAFWNYPENPIYDSTITELVFIPNEISDGFYMLNLQVAPFENDASPSRPVLYNLHEND